MKRLTAALMAALLLTLTACAQQTPCSATIFAMDTVMELSVYGDRELIDEATELIIKLEDRLSVTDETSEISRLNRDGKAELSPDTAELLASALEICDMTEGALDLSVYPAVRAWGFTTGVYRVPDEPELAKLRELVDYSAVRMAGLEANLPSGMMVDLGSVAKGYTGGRVIELMRELGATSALVNLGGNVHALGSKPDGSDWRVGIRDPEGESYLGILSVHDAAVVTSGGYERYFEKDGETYWHIIDPATCRPARSGLLSVTVTGPDGTLCDGLSTALFVMGLERSASLWRSLSGFDAVFVTEAGEVYITEGIEDSFTLSGDYENREIQVIRRAAD